MCQYRCLEKRHVQNKAVIDRPCLKFQGNTRNTRNTSTLRKCEHAIRKHSGLTGPCFSTLRFVHLIEAPEARTEVIRIN